MKIISSLYCHFSCHFNNNNHLISISMCVYTHTAAFSWLAAFLCGLRLRAKKKKAESKHTYVCLSYCSLSKSPLWKRPFIELQRLALPKIAYYLSNIWHFLSSYLWVVFCNCWTIRGIIYHTMTFFLFLFFSHNITIPEHSATSDAIFVNVLPYIGYVRKSYFFLFYTSTCQLKDNILSRLGVHLLIQITFLHTDKCL